MADEQREIERLKAENEEIRQHCVTHDTCKFVIQQTRKDTAREVFEWLFAKNLSFYYRGSCAIKTVNEIAEEYRLETDSEYYKTKQELMLKDGAE